MNSLVRQFCEIRPNQPPAHFLVLLVLIAPTAVANAGGLLETTPSWQVFGQQEAHFGFAVASAGDVNGDGYDDVITGADLYDNGQTDEGGAWLYLGSPAGVDTIPDWSGEGNQANAFFGYSVAPAGDVNGDSYDDIIVGAPGLNRASVYAGSPAGLSATPLWTVAHGGSFGISVASAGNVNGDAYDDIIIGAMNFSNDRPLEGKAWVYLGGAAGPGLTPSWTAEGDQDLARFGYSVSSAGDVNNDGFADVLVGAPDFDNGEMDEGRAFLYLGSAGGLGTSPAWTAESNQAGAAFGIPVAAAGDINGDGYDDVVIASFLYDAGQEVDNGRAWLYVGSASGPSISAVWTYDGQSGNELGIGLGSAGDADRDGYDEVLIGVPHLTSPEPFEGGAFAFRGSATGPSLVPDWRVEGNLPPPGATWAGPHLGWSAAPAGDVNGDGADDVIVGAPFSHCPERPQDCGPIPGWASVYNGIPGSSAITPAPHSPVVLQLLPSRPNPFVPPAMITYILPAPGRVDLSIVDAMGRRIVTLVDEVQGAGVYTAPWDGRDDRRALVASGVYFTRLQALGQTQTQKITFAR